VLRPAARDVLEGLPHLVDRVMYLPYWERGAAAFAGSLIAQSLRTPRYDAAFLTYPAARAAYHVLARAFRARRRIAHRYWPSPMRSLQWLHTTLVDVALKHNVLRNLDLLAAAGIEHVEPAGYAVPPSWVAPPEERDPRRVVLHVGTIAHNGLEARRWPVRSFAIVARWLIAQGFDVTALSGPAEREETVELQKAVPQLRIFEGTLAQTARFLSAARLSVTNDSGIGHLAAGVGSDVIALFGPTPLEHAPFGPNALALRPSACTPCFDVRKLNTGCALGIDYACLKKDLAPDYVIGCIASRLAMRSRNVIGTIANSATNPIDTANAT
jgi:ADP-heptose:LPS heptosyltransferase